MPLADSPAPRSETPPAADRDALVREGLRSLNLTGSLFLRAHLSAPWAYVSPEATEVRTLLNAGEARIIIFHVITEGSCRLQFADGSGADLVAGDIAIMPFSDQHAMGHPSLERAVPLGQILPEPTKTPELVYGGGGPVMSMVCGYLRSEDLPLNPVLASLPPLVRVSTAGTPLERWVDASIEYALHALTHQRPVTDPLLARLPELTITEALCAFARGGEACEKGWLAGLADPIVGRALAVMHREPEAPWTLKELARRAATSRSVLHERFRELIGQAPMSYLAAFRLQLAGRQLRSTTASLAEVAQAVGYTSEASFSRAFKRHVGISPGEWRKAG